MKNEMRQRQQLPRILLRIGLLVAITLGLLLGVYQRRHSFPPTVGDLAWVVVTALWLIGILVWQYGIPALRDSAKPLADRGIALGFVVLSSVGHCLRIR